MTGKFVLGTSIPVWSTKIGSSESHGNECVFNPELFTERQMQYILSQQPIIIVVDGSTSVGDPHRTSPHIPDAFKGYRNHALAINAILGQESDASVFNVPQGFLIYR